jgi:prepilin signal peptidase PulO-like enzyme (type II secretory pathway)
MVWLTLAVLTLTGAVAIYTDLTRRIIPNCLLAASGFVLLMLAIMGGRVVAALVGAAVLVVIALISVAVGGFGMGDLKYLGVVGLGLGPVAGLLALFLAALAAVVWRLPLALRKGAKATFAFGPFIAVGSVMAPLIVLAVAGR